MSVSGVSRTRRLLEGWSANLLQMLLGITQQVALVPVFLYFWTGDILAAWLVIYAAGNVILIADSGLHVRAINRFLALRPSIDCDGRTARFYAAMLRIYCLLAGFLVALLPIAMFFFPPSVILGFEAVPHFDLAFAIMMLGTLLTIPANLATALYRARGYYGRAVRLQSLAMLVAQLGQLVAVGTTGSLLGVSLAYVTAQVFVSIYIVVVDAPRLFPFLRGAGGKQSWRWVAGQFRKAFPFALAGATELALVNAPVLLVSAFASDRIAVVQWGLTRVVAGLLRALCTQVTLPLAAELAHDRAMGLKDQLRSLYARGSVLVSLIASIVGSGLLAFCPDFFAVWTRGTIPYDPLLTATLLTGTVVAAPSILALSYANYSDRGKLLASSKGLQLAVFLVFSFLLIPPLGPLGAAFAIVLCDITVQFGLLTVGILRQTLERPFRHIVFLIVVIAIVTPGGWGLGMAVGWTVPGAGLVHLGIECTVWLMIVALPTFLMWNKDNRFRLAAMIPS